MLIDLELLLFLRPLDNLSFSSWFFSFYLFKLIFWNTWQWWWRSSWRRGGRTWRWWRRASSATRWQDIKYVRFSPTKSFHKYLYKYRRNYSSTGMYMVIKSHFRGSQLNWEHFWSFQYAISTIIAALYTSKVVVKCSSHWYFKCTLFAHQMCSFILASVWKQ